LEGSAVLGSFCDLERLGFASAAAAAAAVSAAIWASRSASVALREVISAEDLEGLDIWKEGIESRKLRKYGCRRGQKWTAGSAIPSIFSYDHLI
jgi:hypothetical protein